MKLFKKIYETNTLALITATCLAALLNCGPAVGDGAATDEDEDPASSVKPEIPNKPVRLKTALKCKKGTSLNYDNFGEAFLLNYCTSCHAADLAEEDRIGAPKDINFNTPELAQIWRANMLDALKDKKNPMPPTEDLSPRDLVQFKEWLNCGAPSGTDNI